MSTNRRNRPVVYRGATERITTVLWGLAVVGFGVGVIAWLDGFNFDLELAGIITLSALGIWILVSSLTTMFKGRDD